MDEVAILRQKVLLAVVDEKVDVRRQPAGLDRREIYAADAGAGIPVAN